MCQVGAVWAPWMESKPQPKTTAEEKPRCAVRGLIRPGAMCGAVIVGGDFCGSSEECPHKLLPNTTDDRR